MISWIASRRREQHFLHLTRTGLETLAFRTRKSAYLGGLTGDTITLVDTVAFDSAITFRHFAVIEAELHSASGAKALLAYAP